MMAAFAAGAYVMINHMAQTLASAMLSLLMVGFSLIPIGGAIEWYYSTEVNRHPRVRLSMIVATSLLLIAVAYWVFAMISSFSTPITSFEFISNGLLLSVIALISYFFVAVQREHLIRARYSTS
jgi:hypothetical protein